MFARPEMGALAGTVFVFVVFAILGYQGGFLRSYGVAGTLQMAAETGILAAPVTLLMIAGQFDLSVGSMIGAAGMFLAIAITVYGLPPIVAVVLTLAFAAVVGFINGLIVVRTGMHSFIVTLAMQLVLRGATIAMTRQITGQVRVALSSNALSNPALQVFGFTLFTIGNARFGIELVWWIVVVVVCLAVLLRTPFGNHVFAAGGSAEGAHYVGVPVQRVKVTLFMATAVCAAIYACIVTSEVGSANVDNGVNMEFNAIICAVIGGTLLSGGYGSVIGSALGALILGIINFGIFYAGIDTDWFSAVLGLLLLLAAVVNAGVLRRASRSR
jgi:simple sugar transport system permease protein